MRNRVEVRRRMGWALMALWVALAAPLQPQAPAEQQMTPQQKAQMDAWIKAMTPGKPHQELAGRAGTWEGKVSMWDAPGAQPQVSAARSERTMGLGGRVLLEHWTGSMMGMPFEGLGTSGFDNADGKWWSTWSDNFGTGVMTSVGTCDPDPKRGCTFTNTLVDPLTGKLATSRSTVLWLTPDDERMEMFGPGPDGKEFKMMEIVTHRVKG